MVLLQSQAVSRDLSSMLILWQYLALLATASPAQLVWSGKHTEGQGELNRVVI